MPEERVSEQRFWLSWYSTDEMGAWTLYRPWWISGERGSDGALTICAAVIAGSEEQAKDRIRLAYDNSPSEIEWRFCERKPDDWSGPFGGRFPRAEWMEWPTP